MIICLLIPLGAASASDINNTAADDQVLSATPNVDTISANVNGENNNDTLSVNDEKNILSAGINDDSGSNTILKAGEDYATFTELNQVLALITSDEFKFTKNYKYNPTTDTLYVDGVTIPEHIKTIDCNGFTMDGNNQAYLFNSINVEGFTLKNLNANNIKTVIRNTVVQNNFTLTNCNISGFTATIMLNGANNININNINVTNGSSIFVRLSNLGNTTIEYSSFSHSTVTSSSQGLIYVNVGCSDTVFRNCNFTDIYVNSQWSGSPIYCQRSAISVYDCRIINCKNRANGNLNNRAYGVFGDPSTFTGERIYVKDFDGYYLFMGGIPGSIINLTIDGCDKVSNNVLNNVNNAFTFDGLKVYNSTRNRPVVLLTGSNSFVKNSLFYNCSYPIQFNGEFGIVNNTQFINCTTQQVSPLVFNNNRNSIIDCTFDNTTSTSTSEYAANAIYTNNKTIKIQNPIFKNMPDNLPNITGEVIDFISFDDIYVKESAPDTGNGSIDNPTNNLTWALNNINPFGKIHIYAGTYNLNNTAFSLRGSLLGEEENVIIKNSTRLTLTINNLNITNILFDDVIFTLTKYTTIKDCNFTNINRTVNIITAGTQSTSFGSLVENIHIYDVNVTNGVTTCEFFTIKNIIIEDSNFTGSAVAGEWRASLLTLEHLTAHNVSCINIINVPYADANQGSVKHINVSNCTLSSLIYTSDNVLYKYVFDNITLKNSTIKNTNGYLIPLKGGCSYNDIHINGVNCNGVSIFKAVNGNANVSNSDFTSIIIDGFLVNGDYNVILDNVTIESSMLNSTVEYPKSNNIYHNLTVKDVSFSSDVSLYLYDGMKLDNAYFENYTGHIMVEGMNVVFDNSCFINGSNDHLNGGVAFVNGSGFKARNSIFKSNNATYGGGFYFNSLAYKPSFIRCTFNDNRANDTIGFGGAIYLLGENVYLGLDTFTNNTINKENNWYNNYFGNISQLYTGYVYVVYNESDWGSSDGSGSSPENAASFIRVLPGIGSDCYIIFVNTTEKYNQSNLRISNFVLGDVNNVTFECNNTIFDNVPFVIEDSATDIAIYNITFSNNTVNSIIWNGENGKINNCIFTSNTADNQGTVFVNASGLNIINSKFTGNKLTNDNGHGGALYINASDIIVEKSIFSNNSVNDNGNHIYIESDLNNIIIFNNTFNVSSVTVGSGAAIFARGTNVNITENNFNDLNGTMGSALHIYGDIGFFNLINNTFSGNNAENGILYLYFTNKYGVENNIKNNMFTGNNATRGGAVYIDVIDNSLFTFENNNFIGNNATYGGAIYNNGVLVDKGSRYNSNNARQDGGAIYNTNTLSLDNGLFGSNSAVNGGAIYNNGVLADKGSRYTGNVATSDGGAIYSKSDLDYSTTESIASFSGNRAVNGGAVYVNGTNNNIRGALFNNNYAEYGSCIYAEDGSDLNVYDVEITDNHVTNGAQKDGGHGDIYLGEIVNFAIPTDSLKLNPSLSEGGVSDYTQYIYNNTMVRSDVLYVSESGTGLGLMSNDPTTLEKAFVAINDNGRIVFVESYMLNTTNINRNVTLAGYNNTISMKRNNTTAGENKYLFILLNYKIIKLKIIHLIHLL